MCGIAGYISSEGNNHASVIEAMTQSIAHRGPDGFGHKIFQNVAIGHRRLSIIDLAAGIQPMASEDQKVWITFNGEIYNYQELKKDLSAQGYHFRTKSDTEVIIAAYLKWGKDCLNKMRGMFAFAIADLTKKEVLIAGDHFGIKPLYVYTHKKTVAFASELQQFGKIPDFESSIDTISLDNYLWLQYIPAPNTIFKSVQKLKPAHYITVSFDGKVSEQIKYWDISFSKKKVKTEKEWMEATCEVIKNSVKAHMVSDVPFGAFLSGGIDSTLVVKYMSEIRSDKIKTFSIGFEEKEYNELIYSEQAANIFGTEHYTQIVRPDALALLPKLVKHYGEPFGDSSALPTYYVCELARKHVTMVLSGDGGDECFAGYGSYLHWMKYMPIHYREGFKRKLYPYLEKYFPSRYPRKDSLTYWISHTEYLNKNWRSKLWKDEFRNSMKDAPVEFDQFYNSTEKYSMANKVQYMDAKTYMPYDILTKVDIASMCHSLEVRTPLIDKEVWEFAATIPEEFNIAKLNGVWEGKLLLKKILSKHFPKEFIYRKKQGFAIPLTRWFSNEGELREKLDSSVLSPNSCLNTYFDPVAMKELLSSDNTGGMWLMLFLEEWLQQFKK